VGEGKRYELERRVVKRGRNVMFYEGYVKFGRRFIARGR